MKASIVVILLIALAFADLEYEEEDNIVKMTNDNF
jgi:hypothetical protein